MDDKGWHADLGEQIPHVRIPCLRDEHLSEHFGIRAFLAVAQVPLERRGIEHASNHSFRQCQ
jgi:hypothetical protein